MIADEDIECYKVLTFRWEDRNKFKTKILHKLGRLKDFQTLFQETPVTIGEVVNAFPVFSQVELNSINLYSTRLYQGFIHSYKHFSDAFRAKRYGWCRKYQVVVKCIIPKGTYYFTGENDDHKDNYASCAIKYVKVVNKAKVKLFTD